MKFGDGTAMGAESLIERPVAATHWRAGAAAARAAADAHGAGAPAAGNPERAVETASWVERRHDLGVDEFRRSYLQPRRPVILTDALRDWPALRLFSHAFFRERFADLPVQVRGRTHRLADIVDQQLASTVEQPGPYPCTLAQCAPLLQHVSPRFACSLPSRHAHPLIPRRVFELVNHLEIFFGGPGGEFPRLHYDMLHMHAWLAQVHGEKEVTLFEHGQEALLYVNPKLPWLSSVQDPHDGERYPLLRQARAHRVVLRAGEALFIPHGTWHTARCRGLNITVAFDQLEASNWRAFVGDVVAEQRRCGRRAQALLLGAYLRLLGPLLSAVEHLGGHRATAWAAAGSTAAAVDNP